MSRIEQEKRVIARMVRLYCRHKEGNGSPCPDCVELIRYACRRLDACPYGESKPTCRRCTIHCYNHLMATRMRMVMRYSGPRMMLYSPLTALRHLLREVRR